ncbi:MAG: formate dehydrogenase accessory sulfurtransferase FdhD [Nevskiaceae bacterium]|nr:MAG: formate dehydrogenase accessory sulfurtransferase FdhD [Nevskiaceae bacterium]TBR73371.1 MAG: formate dehydrogenase accessory sulfurtransferase FdhD [Nevskiaceae bacterium]
MEPADPRTQPPPAPCQNIRLLRVNDGRALPCDDRVATEAALDIVVAGAAPVITMRTPGADRELAAGLLLSEGVIHTHDDVDTLRQLSANFVAIRLRTMDAHKRALLERSSLTSSACGVCGKDKLNLEPMRALPPLPPGPQVPVKTLYGLPDKLRATQAVFHSTGGLHAAALFTATGDLLAVREDIGRHNALDKLNGWALLNDRLPLHDHIVVLSGRASFELLQKCIMARIPIVCAISAPSSYAVRLALEFGVTLVGFLRGRSCNIYSAAERIRCETADAARPDV